MKTKTAIDLAGGATALAVLLKITPGAISQWGDEPPEGRLWQLRCIRPGWFDGATRASPDLGQDDRRPDDRADRRAIERQP